MQKRGWMNGKTLAARAGLSLLFVLTRGLLALPWMLITVPRNDGLTTVLRCAATLAVWLLIVLPEQRFHCWAFMRLNGDEEQGLTYGGALTLELRRFARVSAAAVPAAALGLLLYMTLMGTNFKILAVMRDIGSVTAWFGLPQRPGYDVGFGIVAAALLITLIVLAVLWYRGTPNDYLGTGRPWRKARFDGTAARNFLLALVAYALWALILYLFLAPVVRETEGLLRKATGAVSSLKTIVRQREFLLEMGLVLILVYCPLWCVRKYLAARAAVRLRDEA